jgi:hypothetical protein
MYEQAMLAFCSPYTWEENLRILQSWIRTYHSTGGWRVG